MASNPAAANVTIRSSSLSSSDQSLRMGSSRQIGGSQFGRGFPVEFGASGNTMRPEVDTLYRIQVAGHRPQVDGSFEPDYLETRSPKYLYGDYWEPSLTVFPLATFEAQLYMQMLPELENVQVTPYQGNEAYSATKGIIEETWVSYKKEENPIEENQISLSIKDRNLLLGTWQGLYLFEHRLENHKRKVIHHFIGD